MGRWSRALLGAVVVCLLPLCSAAQQTAETGTIAGIVLDKATGDPIIEAGVEVVGTGRTVRTDIDGKYAARVPPGTYEVRIFAPLYQGTRLQNVTVKPNQVTKADASLATATGKAGVEVVEVIAQANRAAEATQLLQRKQSAVVSETISGETLKKTPGSSVADVVKRAPAVTVRDDKFVYVRGLGERYSYAQLNRSRLPSTDPEKRVVPLDLFPADFLESLAVIKSYTPDLPGDFAGGLVDLRLRDFPEQASVSLGMSGNVNTQVTGKDFNTYRGPTVDYAGFGAWHRRVPGAIPDDPRIRTSDAFTLLGRTFADNWAIDTIDAPPGAGLNFAAGDTFGPLGVQFGAFYQNEYKRSDQRVRQFVPVNGEPSTVSDYRFDYSSFTTKVAGVFTSALKLGPDHKLTFRSFVNQNSIDQVQFGNGQNDNIGFNTGQIEQQTTLFYNSEYLGWGQLGGEHRLPWFSVDWRISGARSGLDTPDTRYLTYRGDPDLGPLSFVNDGLSGQRIFNTLTEWLTDSALDVTVPFRTGLPGTDLWSDLPGKFKFGPAYSFRMRESQQRIFLTDTQANRAALDLTQPPEELFGPSNFGPGGVQFEELTQPRDFFSATEEIIGGYGMFDLPIVRDQLRIVAGTRVEYSLIRLQTTDEAGIPISPRKKNVDILPGFNMIWSPRDDMNFRMGYGQSVSRPEFRELSGTLYPAPRGLRDRVGNPNLVEATIQSYDFRWEWFFSPLELVSGSVFFKELDQPIEQTVIQLGNDLADSFANADKAEVIGFEIEARKDLGFASPSLRYLSLLTNVTYAQSTATIPRGQFQAQTSTERDLQGLAPYVVNAALDYTHPRWGTARLLYTTAGPTIAAVGSFGLPDVLLQRRNQVDAVLLVPLQDLVGVPLTFKLSVENMLNDPVAFTQADSTQLRFSTGVKFSFGVSYQY